MKAYLVQRVLKTTCDQVVRVSVQLFELKPDAEQFAAELQRGMESVLSCDVVKIRGDVVTPLEFPVKQFLVDLGVVAFRHEVTEIEVHGKIHVPPPAPLVSLQ